MDAPFHSWLLQDYTDTAGIIVIGTAETTNERVHESKREIL